MRLDKYLCEAGLGTRSQVKKLLKSGTVTINGEPALRPEQKVEEQDKVAVAGREISAPGLEYWMLYKPAGCVSATEDRRFQTVIDLLPESAGKDLFPVGRLDRDTEGLLLLTNDGKLAHELLSPKKHVDKTYYAELDRELSPDGALRLEAGVDIGDERPTLPCSLRLLEPCRILITIREGRYHQIKRMLLTEGCTVTYLKRLSMGPLELDESLKKGEYRPLSEHELSLLKDPMSGSSAHIQQ